MPPAAQPYVERAGRRAVAPAGVPIATPVPQAAVFHAAPAPTAVIRLPEATRHPASPRPSGIAQAISHIVDMAPANSVLDLRTVSGPDGVRTTTVQLEMTTAPAQPPANAAAGGWWHPTATVDPRFYGPEWDGDERRP